jgi:hypothetical protein
MSVSVLTTFLQASIRSFASGNGRRLVVLGDSGAKGLTLVNRINSLNVSPIAGVCRSETAGLLLSLPRSVVTCAFIPLQLLAAQRPFTAATLGRSLRELPLATCQACLLEQSQRCTSTTV